VTYIITEGRIDAESVKNAVEAAEQAVSTIGGEE
jgi:5S rRNA maturation endonuclease (ribonuclease M5)